MTVERMIELLEIEKECVRRNACGECNRACHICDLLQDDTELHEMYEEVIALLKAQEPHVMTLGDLRDIGSVWELNTPPYLWMEINPTYRWMRGCWVAWREIYDMIDGLHPTYDADNYLKIWRCWTSRPDEKRRAETPWQISGTV